MNEDQKDNASKKRALDYAEPSGNVNKAWRAALLSKGLAK